jgi:hypothetical protein
MPYFNFDLVIGEDFKNQGGMILEDSEMRSTRLIASQASFVLFVLSSVRGDVPCALQTETVTSSTVLRSTSSRRG